MNSKQIALIAVLVAVSVGSNYALISFYNVKLMDMIVFVSGFCFGPAVGAATGSICWAVYGPINPYGFSLHVWVATVVGESIYGLVGGLLGKSMRRSLTTESTGRSIDNLVFFGAFGVILTLVYDVITNIAFGYLNNWNILFSVVSGFVPFGVMHVASNAFFFGVGCRPAITAVLEVTGGGESSDNTEK
jgi:uncharacterized membrane protein